LQFWNTESLKEGWISNSCQLKKLLCPIRSKLSKILNLKSNNYIIDVFDKNLSPECVLQCYPTIESFESDVIKALGKMCLNNYFQLDMMKECFRIEMISFKQNLDTKKRSFFTSIEGKRLNFEKKLRPSSATLIIVPVTLLEHWLLRIFIYFIQFYIF
jgi:hypothetical protein